MGKIDYKTIYDKNKHGWYDMTEDPQKYEALLAGHYSDSNHFVYELLQNAEDAFDKKTGVSASKVVVEYYSDKLVFYHNGKPFDEADARGVSSMLMGTKDRDDAQTIGRFGMGFKSVFKYTYQPEIYSDNEAFKITRYLLPVEITEGWDYEAEKKAIVCKLNEGRSFTPFLNEEHITKIVIPFLKYGKDGKLVSVPGDDVLKKLDKLNGEILLFLSHIKKLYWVNKETGKYAYITMQPNENDKHLITCRIEGTDYDGKEEISRYLKFDKKFNHPEMENAEVSVAYKLNSRADNINEVESSPVCVYFPTRDDTDLPILIHGSFETAVSREKLMSPSSFNRDLFEQLGDLISNSLVELADRKLITQVFLKRVILGAFSDEEKNNTIPGLKEKISEIVKERGLIPDRNGEYRKPEEMLLPVPFRIADFEDRLLFGKVFENKKKFVAFNNEREANFSSYFTWLVNDLGIEVYKLSSLAKDMCVLEDKKIATSGENYEALKDFYDFLSDNREAVYSTGLAYSRSGPYEAAVRQDISNAWMEFRKAPIILNRLNILVPSEKDGKPGIYLGASSDYKNVMQSALVNTSVASIFGKVLSEGFLIQEFNNYQYIKEKVVDKYINIEEYLGFKDHDNYTEEYIEDINQILSLISITGNQHDIQDMLKDAWIIKIKTKKNDVIERFAKPNDCYVPISQDGINLRTYYEKIPFEEYKDDVLDPDDDEQWFDFNLDMIDSEFYENNGIAITDLVKLGVRATTVSEGDRKHEGIGDGHWIAMGEYCPDIEIDGLEDNLNYISENSDQELAQRKSAEILKLLLAIAPKLQGKRKYRKNNPYEGELEDSHTLKYIIKYYDWLYDKNMKVNNTANLSKYDLNIALYGNVIANKGSYEILGFIEKDVDDAEDTLQKAQGLNRQDKMRLLRWLAKDLGQQVSTQTDDEDDWEDEDGELFNPEEYQDNEFPVNSVNNFEYLIRHVQEQFYCADPTKYSKVLRQIRVSKNSKADRSYSIGMYTNSSNTKICQICREPVAFIEVDQIANFGIEMPQLNLCLCRNCSGKYRAMRDGNKDEFKRQIKAAIMAIDVNEYSNEYSIMFNEDTVLYFTQTHVAELQEILRLLSVYGTPSNESDSKCDENVSGPLMHKITNDDETKIVEDADEAKSGCFITYKKRFSNEDIADNILQPDKYPLHKAFEGHCVGDIITFKGKEYEIIGIL